MKLFSYLLLLFLGFSVITACSDDGAATDDDQMHMEDEFEYHAHIMSPTADDKHVGDSIHIHVNFEDHKGGAIHHIKVRIYDKADDTIVIYDMPTDAHVHDMDGYLEWHDDIELTVDAPSDWILEAKVWGHEAGLGEVIETVEFHVHP